MDPLSIAMPPIAIQALDLYLKGKVISTRYGFCYGPSEDCQTYSSKTPEELAQGLARATNIFQNDGPFFVTPKTGLSGGVHLQVQRPLNPSELEKFFREVSKQVALSNGRPT